MSAIIKTTGTPYNDEILEKVILKNDLSSLSPLERVLHVKQMCESLGLNPLTQPIKLLEFQGKIMPYMAKDGTEQLRKIHNVSILNIETRNMDGIYIVIANASLPSGRTDASTGAVSIVNLKGDAMCNAMMKAETKAKRRATLSICGLGMLDESEIDTMQGARKLPFNPVKNDIQVIVDPEKNHIEHEKSLDEMILEMQNAPSMDELEKTFKHYYRINMRNLDLLKLLGEAKDKLKDKFSERKDFIREMDEEDIQQ